MTLEMVVIAVVRLLGALPVLRWPLYGALIAIAVDQSDLFMMNLLRLGGVSDYQTFDKYLDQAYLATFLISALHRRGLARDGAIALYAYRFAGFVAFELTRERWLLLLFPNLFEFWFVFWAADERFGLLSRLSTRARWALATALIALKLGQEYAIHYARLLDGFTAVEAVEAVWRWLPLT